MIIYNKGAFGVKLLFRLHGSGLYRAMIPGLFSVLIYFGIHEAYGSDTEDDLIHPYAVGVLVGSVSFLIVFRANFGYQRYWEAVSATFHMMSKWMDATSHTSAYHMQCDHYKHIKPPSYFDYPELNKEGYTRDRERGSERVERSTDESSGRPHISRSHKSINFVEKSKTPNNIASSQDLASFGDGDPTPLMGVPRLDGGWKGLFGDGTATYYSSEPSDIDIHQGFSSTKGGRTPSLFLQEIAHLTSLLNAVALSTLRNDVEGAESPLDIYEPGSSWPEADPDMVKTTSTEWRLVSIAKYVFSVDRAPEARTQYNSSRPLPVLGGVSDNEIKFLQMARGPSAKTQLAWYWLSEFISREHLAGSTGEIGAPIISRVMQFLGDGMLLYNHARKIMYIPFPFPHAQLSVFYVLAVIPTVPFLMDQYTNEPWLGAILSFFTVTCLAGLHEVARELENPFRNVPNEIPVVTLQAMFNETLLTIYSGYHPDAYWAPSKTTRPTGMDRENEPEMSKRKMNPESSGSGNVVDSKNANGKKLPEPSVSFADSSNENLSDITQLMKVVQKQSKEIERLRRMVEDKDGVGRSEGT